MDESGESRTLRSRVRASTVLKTHPIVDAQEVLRADRARLLWRRPGAPVMVAGQRVWLGALDADIGLLRPQRLGPHRHARLDPQARFVNLQLYAHRTAALSPSQPHRAAERWGS